MTTTVTSTFDNGLARITLDGPATRNSLDRVSAAALVAACDAIDADATVGVAVITGTGGAFCSGAARNELAGLGDAPADRMYEDLSALYRAFERVGRLAVPTIARIEGPAVGAGLNLAMAADLRIAAPSARLISGFAAIGIHPGGGHLHLIARAAGQQTAAAMGVFARPMTAADAKAVGLVWDVAADGRLDELVDEAAAPLRADPALARALKASLQLTTSGGDAWAAATEVERARQMWSLGRRGA